MTYRDEKKNITLLMHRGKGLNSNFTYAASKGQEGVSLKEGPAICGYADPVTSYTPVQRGYGVMAAFRLE